MTGRTVRRQRRARTPRGTSAAGAPGAGDRGRMEKRPVNWTLAPSTELPDWFPWRPEPPFAE